MRLVTALGGAIGVSALVLKLFPIPFLWIGFTWAVTGLAIAIRAPSPVQPPLVVAASASFAVALGEVLFAVTESSPPQLDLTTVPFLNKPDPLLGWKLEPSQVSQATGKVIGGALIYDVVYSIDSMGRRISPPDRGDKVEGCSVFFADSITFGWGVSDHETFPYQVGLKSGGRFRVINLAVHGYGAEHMLATVERGDLALAPCDPTHIFYVAAPHHILRAAGKVTYATYGPQYRLGPTGIPEYLGTKPEPPKSWWRWRDRLV